jgi:hypothetical protein
MNMTNISVNFIKQLVVVLFIVIMVLRKNNIIVFDRDIFLIVIFKGRKLNAVLKWNFDYGYNCNPSFYHVFTWHEDNLFFIGLSDVYDSESKEKEVILMPGKDMVKARITIVTVIEIPF